MLNEEVKRYRELSGDNNPHTPISRIGGYLDGYEKAMEQEPCEDAISRQAAINEINTLIAEYIPLMPTGWTLPLNIARTINELPPVTPQPKMGRWVFDKILDKHYYCSECKSMGVDYWDFCPNCGAKMEVEE